jgi:hypothetical protein
MPIFIMNAHQQSNGIHEIHNLTTRCPLLPRPENQIDLGHHPSWQDAMALARRLWPRHRINGCYYCTKNAVSEESNRSLH